MYQQAAWHCAAPVLCTTACTSPTAFPSLHRCCVGDIRPQATIDKPVSGPFPAPRPPPCPSCGGVAAKCGQDGTMFAFYARLISSSPSSPPGGDNGGAFTCSTFTYL
ncbi:hypothetical protein E2C01_009969 [Portunus trituberculatus]|uniref:Uncharacterized protein n=1 Tax=Portunus trituberculatus TaxID=210409 RepID=A0A5B7D742_PORTR|nr:hypothetical protein [Portunus trituberculatus]